MWLLFVQNALAQRSAPLTTRWVRALADPNFKVRLEAVILIGNNKTTGGIPNLRKLLSQNDEHDSVRAAACVSLAKLHDEESRNQFGFLIAHNNQLIAKSAEKALIMLDQARPKPPFYLLEIERPLLPKGVAFTDGQWLITRIKDFINRTGGLVPGAGEYEVLSPPDLAAHLSRRKLTGFILKPELTELRTESASGRTTFFATMSIAGFSLVEKEPEFTVSGQANSWMDGASPIEAHRQEMQHEVLDRSADSAMIEVVKQLAAR
jgi:HEAT repeat.